ncbi:MAG TPA: hypothetical protein VKF32_08100 [Thermoanaerobaculia bacterium]|nr:hypothetical protein [Thermoanaerobaculia bacterium]
MKKKVYTARALGLALLAGAALACATTTFSNTWRSPDAQRLQFRGQKVLAVFVSSSESVRRRAEDTLAREISARGAEGVPSYTVLSQDEVKDPERAKAKVEPLGFAGSVVMRVVARDTEVTYEPGVVIWGGPHYRRFWGGYWGWGWGHVWEPGYVRADRVVSVETLVYSFKQDELVWAGTSRTVNPDRVEGLVSELAGAIAKQMEKEGLIARV